MNGLDIFICIVLAFGLVRGVTRGLIKEVASIAGVLVGGYVALTYYHGFTDSMADYVKTAEVANLLAFFFLFIIVFLGVAAVGVIIKYFLKIAHLGNVDRVFGAIFGLSKGILISAVVVFGLTLLLPQGNAKALENSFMAPHVTRISASMVQSIPDQLKQGFDDKLTALQDKWKADKKKAKTDSEE